MISHLHAAGGMGLPSLAENGNAMQREFGALPVCPGVLFLDIFHLWTRLRKECRSREHGVPVYSRRLLGSFLCN